MEGVPLLLVWGVETTYETTCVIVCEISWESSCGIASYVRFLEFGGESVVKEDL